MAMAQSLADIEAANEQLVRAFFATAATVDFDNPDPAYLRTYLAEDFAYRYEDVRIEGLDTYIAQQLPQMSSVESYDVDLRRIAVIGNTVLNERVDVATLKDGQQHRWTVSSVILVSDGKIAEWRDYPLPGAAAGP
jgi:limonene-1,2-epoxide hydrolase